MKGRIPKPTALKLIQGNPGRRPLNKSEPKPENGIPRCPTWLKGEGRKLYQKLSKILHGMNLVTKADGEGLAMLCDAWGEWRQARETIEAEGQFYESPTKDGGFIKRPHPAINIASDAWKRIKSIMVEFGLTPSARCRLTTGEVETSDPLEELMKRRNVK